MQNSQSTKTSVKKGFVDDTQSYNNKHSLSESVSDNVKLDLTTYQTLIKYTGGQLNTSKCAHSIIQWVYNNK